MAAQPADDEGPGGWGVRRGGRGGSSGGVRGPGGGDADRAATGRERVRRDEGRGSLKETPPRPPPRPQRVI